MPNLPYLPIYLRLGVLDYTLHSNRKANCLI